MKYFRLSWEQILWEINWVNLQMLAASIPNYEAKSSEDDEDDTNVPAPITARDIDKFFNF